MSIENDAPDALIRLSAGFGNHHVSEAIARRPARGPEFAPAPPLGPLCGTAFRHGLHRAPAREPAKLALPPAAQRRSSALSAASPGADPLGPVRMSARRSQPPALGPDPDPGDAAGFRRGAGHHRRQWRCGDGRGASGVHLYLANRSMTDRVFYDADGEFLIVPQEGALRLVTEFGVLELKPGEMGVVPRGVKFRAELPDGSARGYICENYGALLPPARAWSPRLQRPRQCAGFPDPRRRFEDRVRPHRGDPEIPGRALVDHPRSLAAGRGGVAREPSPPTNTTSPGSTRSARSASTIPIRRSSPS